MNTRNTKRKAQDGNSYSYYEDGTREPVNLQQNDWTTGVDPSFVFNIRLFIRYAWMAIKLIVIFILLCPFLDKLRQSEIMNKTINIVKDYDIGCKPCVCNTTVEVKPIVKVKANNGDVDGGRDLLGI